MKPYYRCEYKRLEARTISDKLRTLNSYRNNSCKNDKQTAIALMQKLIHFYTREGIKKIFYGLSLERVI